MAKKLKAYRMAVGRPVTVEVMAESAKDAARRILEKGEGDDVYEDDGFVAIGRPRRYPEGDPEPEEG